MKYCYIYPIFAQHKTWLENRHNFSNSKKYKWIKKQLSFYLDWWSSIIYIFIPIAPLIYGICKVNLPGWYYNPNDFFICKVTIYSRLIEIFIDMSKMLISVKRTKQRLHFIFIKKLGISIDDMKWFCWVFLKLYLFKKLWRVTLLYCHSCLFNSSCLFSWKYNFP